MIQTQTYLVEFKARAKTGDKCINWIAEKQKAVEQIAVILFAVFRQLEKHTNTVTAPLTAAVVTIEKTVFDLEVRSQIKYAATIQEIVCI